MFYTLKILAIVVLFFASRFAVAADDEQNFRDSSAVSALVGQAYFDAYISMNWDEVALRLAEKSKFSDPTAAQIWGTPEQTGKSNIVKNFMKAYRPLTMRFTPTRKIFSGNFALFEGTLDWSYELPQRTITTEKMPFVVVLRLENGLIVEHRDYADYTPFFIAEKAAGPH